LLITAAYTLRLHETAVSIAIPVIFMVVFGLGLPTGLYFLIPRQQRKQRILLTAKFANKFGCAYQTYYFRRSWYFLVVLGKRLFLACVVGFIADQGAQVALIIGGLILYVVQLIFVKPYMDNIHMMLDVTVNVCNICSTVLMISFMDTIDLSLNVKGYISAVIAGVQLLSMLLCIMAFIDSWLKGKRIHSWKHFYYYICCRGKDRSIDIELDVEGKQN